MLHEERRPQQWSEVAGQPKAVKALQAIADSGRAGGRAYWLSGASGTGKTTLAKLLAGAVADELCIEELDSQDLTPARIREIERQSRYRGIGLKDGRAYIVNEAHGLRQDSIRQLLVALERIPGHVVWIFTTTIEGQEKLFGDCDDSSPLLSRCLAVNLARRDLSGPFAERLAQIDPMGPRGKEWYVKLLQKHKNNLRAAIGEVEVLALIESAESMAE